MYFCVTWDRATRPKFVLPCDHRAIYILKNKNCMFYACFAKILLLLLVNSYGGARAGRRDEIYYE